jgi:putative transposase
MIQAQVKLRVKHKQEIILYGWLFILRAVWNWAIRKIELDAKDGIYYTKQKFQNLLKGHGEKVGIPSHTFQGILCMAWDSWQRCYKKLAKKPKLKGWRNPLSSIPFPDPIRRPDGVYIKIPGLGVLKFHKQEIPEGNIKCGRIIKRASGWYLCLYIDAVAKAIPKIANRKIGIDPGYKTTLTLSTGEKIDMTKEFARLEKRLRQASKSLGSSKMVKQGERKKEPKYKRKGILLAKLHEKIKNRRKDNNHKLSRKLVSENSVIVFSKDNIKGLARRFGRSVAEASHYQLRTMLSYKSHAGGREYLEVESKKSTMTCSSCLALTGPTGLAGLQVRRWKCSCCGAEHDRDVNAAINTLISGFGTNHERKRELPSGIPCL